MSVALLLSLFLSYWVVRTSIVSETGRTRPRMAAMVAAKDPSVVAALAERELRTRMGRTRPSVARATRQALNRAPFMDDPFLLDGIDRLMRRDRRAAEALLQHALDRNPRSRLARLFMLEFSLRRGDVSRAAMDMTILGRLMPDVQTIFLPELARLAHDPRTRGPLQQALRSDRRMLESLLHHMASKGADPALILGLAGNLRTASPEAPGDWRAALIDSMIKKGKVRGAHRLWAHFGGKEPKDRENLIYDGDFEGLPGLTPFNWALSSSDLGAAERDKPAGLQVEYYGRAPGDLASQLLVLPPGPYRLSFRAEGDAAGPQARLIWRVQCQPGPVILELPLTKITYTERILAANFTVPPACSAQWLKLVGEPTEFPKIENVSIRNLKLQRTGGRS